MEIALKALSTAWRLYPHGQRLSILIYHQVLPERDPLRPDAPDIASFDWQMDLLARHTDVLSLPEAVQRLKAGKLPPRATVVTFDDGYADNHDHALPILKKHGIPATFFIATGYLNGGCMFNDAITEAIRDARQDTLDLTELGLGTHSLRTLNERAEAVATIVRATKFLPPEVRRSTVREVVSAAGSRPPTQLMMTDNQVRALQEAGMTIGAHTVTHPILQRVDDDTAWREISESRAHLTELCDRPVEFFAYPNGKPGQDYQFRDRDLVQKAGFRAAVCTSGGVSIPGHDPYQLARFTPWDQTAPRFLARLFLNTRNPGNMASAGSEQVSQAAMTG